MPAILLFSAVLLLVAAAAYSAVQGAKAAKPPSRPPAAGASGAPRPRPAASAQPRLAQQEEAAPNTFLPPRDGGTWRPMLRSEADPVVAKAFASSIPTIPIAAGRLASALEDPRTDPRTIARIASTDPSLAARFLMMVNSVYFGLPKRTGDLNRAVMLLGYAQIKGIVFRSILNETLNQDGVESAALDRLWERSYLVSIGAPILAQELGGVSTPNLSTAGLFLDVGKIALLARYRAKAKTVYANGLTDDRKLARREEDVFGLNHAVAGVLLAEKWKLPADVTSMIECHVQTYFWSAPFLPAEEMRTVAVLHLAELAVDQFLGRQDEPDEIEGPQPPEESDPFYFHLFGLEPPITDHMTQRLVGALRDGQAFLAQLGTTRSAVAGLRAR